MIKRNTLPPNQSKMYVYVQDEINKIVRETKLQKALGTRKENQNGN